MRHTEHLPSPHSRAPSGTSDHIRCCIGTGPITRSQILREHPEVRALPSTGVTRLHRYYGPLRRPNGPPVFPPTLESPPSVPGLPQLPRPPYVHAVPTTPADRTGARVGCFPARAAFPAIVAGRRPRLHFRGLLMIHSRYGLHACSLAFPRGLSRGFNMIGYPFTLLVSYPSYLQLTGWVLPPLVVCAFGAHIIAGGKARCFLPSDTPGPNNP